MVVFLFLIDNYFVLKSSEKANSFEEIFFFSKPKLHHHHHQQITASMTELGDTAVQQQQPIDLNVDKADIKSEKPVVDKKVLCT